MFGGSDGQSYESMGGGCRAVCGMGQGGQWWDRLPPISSAGLPCVIYCRTG